MQFAHPELAWLLLLLPATLLIGAASNHLRRKRLSAFADSALFEELIPNFKSIARQAKIRTFWILLITTCLVVSCLRPQWGYTWRPTTKRGVDIVVAVDVSESMMVEDVKPNRLGRAHRKILDLLAEFRGDRVGLVAFAGVAFTETPLTLDYGALRSYVTSLNPSLIPIKGTNIEHAIKESIRTLEKGGLSAESSLSDRSRAIILITDGEEFDGDLSKVSQLAEEKKIALYIMGVGTVEGGPIPSPKGYKKDKQGKVVISKLRPDVLQDLASKTKGIFVQSIGTDEDTKAIYNSGIRQSLASSEVSGQRSKIWHEYFQFPLLVSLVCLLIGPWGSLFSMLQRRNVLSERDLRHQSSSAVLALVIIFSPDLLYAESTEAKGATGVKMFQQGQFDEALRVFREAATAKQDDARFLLGEGASAYRLGDYATALRAFSSAIDLAKEDQLKSQVLFNTGNAQVQLGDFQAAIESYEKSLKLNSKDNEALENLAYAKRLLEQQQNSDENQDKKNKDSSSKEQSKKDQQKKDQSSSPQQKDTEQKDTEQKENKDKEDSQTEKQENQEDSNSNKQPDSPEDPKPEDTKENDSKQSEESKQNEDSGKNSEEKESEDQPKDGKQLEDSPSPKDNQENKPDDSPKSEKASDKQDNAQPNQSNEQPTENEDLSNSGEEQEEKGEQEQAPQLSQESQMKLDSIEERRNARYNYRFNKAIQQLKQEQKKPPEKDW